MIIKKCDVCKNETDALYDKMIATHTDTISGNNIIRQDKLHICRVCMKSIIDTELTAQLGWYEDNIKEDNENTSDDVPGSNDGNESTGNNEQNGGHTEGSTMGD